jgi:HD superfamily phosphodiesterase
MLIDHVREHVRQACARETNVFGPAFFDEHIAVVADCATRLAGRLLADVEVVQLAAWLHDFSAVCDPATLPDHARASADLAACLLAGYGCPSETIARVTEAITLHSTPVAPGDGSTEAICVSHADSLSRILRPAYWLYFAFSVRKLPYAQGRDWLRALVETQWPNLVSPAHDIGRHQHAATLRLLSA